jgi:hypothetical protein
MKSKIWILSIFLTATHLCWGQANKGRNDTLSNPIKILYILTLPNKPPIATENVIVAPVHIDTLYDITNKSIELSRILGVSHVWVLRPRYHTQFFSLNQILNLYQFNKEDQTLPIRIDNWVVDYPETILAEENEIVNVEIVNNRISNFIDIKTRHPFIKRKHTKSEMRFH